MRLLLLLALAGCAPPWRVVRQGAPLASSTPLAVEVTTFDDLRVQKGTEADHLAHLSPEQQQAWQDEKASFASTFATTVVAHRGALDVTPGGADGRALVRSHVVELEPGEFDGFFNAPTVVRTRVAIADASGKISDEIELRCVVPADLDRPSATLRITECGRRTGLYAARYLESRARSR